MRKKTAQQRAYYFSDRLKRQLDQIPNHPLTIVEAPSGFGKTTAVREYLKENLPSGAQEYWYTCLGEPVSVAWKGICELFSNANREIALNLEKLEMPTMDTLMYMMVLLRDCTCRYETYLVIDNYQLFLCDVPRELVSVFSMHGDSNLHIIFITQQLGSRQQFTIHNADIHTIGSSAFFFDKEGTAALFRMEGIRLSQEELNRVFKSTEGWVSALRLQILNYEEHGSFDPTADIEHLVEGAIWNRLTPEEKEFLLSVSIMDSFTGRQAAIMMNREVLPEAIENLLKSNDFIRYFPDRSLYTMHSILQDYLRNRFYHHQSEEFQKRMLRLAGKSLAAVSQYFAAAQFFFKVGDFDAMLCLPFDGGYLANQRERRLMEFVVEMAGTCPEEALCRYPFVLLIFAYPMLFERQMETFEKLCRMIALSIEKNPANLSPDELRRLEGEYILLTSFTAYNDIRKMSEGRRAALEILGGPSSIIVKSMPWTFGGTSVFNMFWRETGKLDEALRDMDECLPYYLKLTRGHGAGGDSVFRAEALLMRGEDELAEILCHKALYDARSHGQIAICLCAELVLARISMLRGNVEGYFTAVQNIKNYTKEDPNLYILRMVDLCMTVLSLAMGITDHVAKWFGDVESMKRTLYAPTVPYAQILFSHLLLIDKRYSVLYGMSSQILDMAKSLRYVLPQVYHHIFLAVAKLNGPAPREARGHVKEALALALPDKVYLPFAQQHDGQFQALLESLKGEAVDKESLHAIKALERRQAKGVQVIKKALEEAKSPLTPREKEIALLAKERFSIKEIADQLYISTATVKTILKNVYNKLDIHSKSELNLRDF